MLLWSMRLKGNMLKSGFTEQYQTMLMKCDLIILR